MNKTAVVTGGSSGIGRATAALLAKEGWRVFEFSRRDVPQSGVTHIYADITKPETVCEAVGRVVSESGGIDLLINNAGSGISGAVEFTEGIEVEFSVKTLFVGMDTVTRCCLPHIRKARGRIVCISSAAAVLPVPFQTYYSAMKAAVNAYTMSLANEVRRFGVSVCAVMPGDTSTGFTASRSKETKGNDIYGGAVSRSVGKMEKDETHGVSPEKVARVVVRCATKRHVKPLYAVGFQYKLFCVLAKLLPCGMTNRLIGSLYSK